MKHDYMTIQYEQVPYLSIIPELLDRLHHPWPVPVLTCNLTSRGGFGILPKVNLLNKGNE